MTDTPDAPPTNLYVVGIGASAGGLEALQQFFSGMPPTGGFAFVVVQHLSPDFKSLMDELLSPHTSLKIHQARNGLVVEPDCIYLMPPKHEMTISGGRLLLTARDPHKGLSLPIDAFFRSLARTPVHAPSAWCCRARAAMAPEAFAPSTRPAGW